MKGNLHLFSNWFFEYEIGNSKIVKAKYLLRSEISKKGTDEFDHYFMFYLENGYFKEFPPFEIRDFTQKEEKVYILLFNNWDKVLTYGELSDLAGMKKAARFIGQCMKKNPLPLIIPCHHVYSRYKKYLFTPDPQIKRFLLEKEKRFLK